MNDRSDLIIRYFDYLVSDYNFKIQQKDFNPGAMGNAYVIYESQKIGLEIVIDRDQVLISIGDKDDPRKNWFEFSNIMRYFAPSIKEAYIFTIKTADNTWDEVIESQLKRVAEMLKKYCEPLLIGDFSMKSEIKEIQEKRKTELIEILTNKQNKHKNNV